MWSKSNHYFLSNPRKTQENQALHRLFQGSVSILPWHSIIISAATDYFSVAFLSRFIRLLFSMHMHSFAYHLLAYLTFAPSPICLNAFLNWKKNSTLVKLTARKSAIGSAKYTAMV